MSAIATIEPPTTLSTRTTIHSRFRTPASYPEASGPTAAVEGASRARFGVPAAVGDGDGLGLGDGDGLALGDGDGLGLGDGDGDGLGLVRVEALGVGVTG